MPKYSSVAVTLPSIASVGTEFHSTGVPTATLPATHVANDILVLILQSSNDSNVAAPAGYQQLGPENGIGLAAAAGSTKLSIFWKRDGGSESAPTIPDTGDHTYGVMLAVHGCATTGDPFHFLGNAFKLTASTTGTSPVGSTVIDNCLVMDIFGHSVDSASAQASAEANSGLGSVTEQFDGGTTDGTGGGIVVVTGSKAMAGQLIATTLTWANSTVDVSSRIAWIPGDKRQIGNCPARTEVQTFIGSGADLDDTWVKPSGAVRVLAQLCDGGGSGSGGNTATTAAGGGGGGGGGYDEAWFTADELAATITVHAGKGGAVGTGLNQAGNAGVISEFDKGAAASPLSSAHRVAGTAAVAAASADGGNGGGGSGRGQIGVGVGSTFVGITGSTAGAALGGRGAIGGSGTTAPTAGSNAEWGGGGGESGADTDTAISGAGAIGSSMRGAGGGGGGRTNTEVSTPGAGGGAASPTAVQGAAGNSSTRMPYGGSGGCAGGSTTATGGSGGFPGGGGGGGGGVAGGFGGKGGDGCIVVTTFF